MKQQTLDKEKNIPQEQKLAAHTNRRTHPMEIKLNFEEN
jgi:hypothetical protein